MSSDINLKSSPRLPYSFDEENKDLKCWSIIEDGLLRSNKIDKIKDDDASGRLLTASIPSPLARIYLFKNAFEFFAKSENKEKPFDGPYAALVSDCLDFLQFLFENQDNNAIVIKEWKIEGQLNSLKSSDNKKHQHLGESLELFFDSEDFNGFEVIQLIFYKKGGEEILIGGTSPFTWLYTSPNWRREVIDRGIVITSTNHQDEFFDEEVFALAHRDVYFRKYLYTLAQDNPDYIISNYIKFIKDNFDRNTNIDEDFINGLKDITHTDLSQNDISISISSSRGNLRLKRYTSQGQDDSDLKIKYESDLYLNNSDYKGQTPLVIVPGLNFNGRYFGETPYKNDCIVLPHQSISTRRVPGTSVEYPYLTTEDFFEEKLISLPFKANESDFYIGIGTLNEEKSFLVPLKKRFFDFFKVESLNRYLSFQHKGTSIVYTLNVPVIGGQEISLKKVYDLEEDVSDLNIGLAIFPLLKYFKMRNNQRTPAYNSYKMLAFIENGYEIDIDIHSLSSLNIKDGSTNISEGGKEDQRVISSERRTNTSLGFTKHFKINTDFDFLCIKTKLEWTELSGLIVPKFEEREEGQQVFSASIDFGTTNTFVGIDNGNSIEALKISKEEMCVGLLNKTGSNLFSGFGLIQNGMEKVLKTEFIPPAIQGVNGQEGLAFPIRTVSVYDISDENPKNKELFLYSNIAFYYEQDRDNFGPSLRYNYISNIKPLFELGAEGVEEHVKSFIEELLFIIKCKVLYNNGSLRGLNLIWSYPSTGGFKNSLREIFDDLIPDVFGTDDDGNGIVKQSKNISESLAPFVYLREYRENKKKIIPDLDEGVSINVDIGGGTTDFVFYDSIEEKYHYSSVKFAGNDLWGGGLSNEKDNGFILAWESLYNDKLERADSQDMDFLRYKALKGRPGISASDKINLLFKYNETLRFTDIFKNQLHNFDRLKYPMLLHLSSIFHYAIQWSTNLGVSFKEVRNISFSGKGSSYINLIFSQSELEEFLKAYLDSYNEINNTRLSIRRAILLSNPKEVTALGALFSLKSDAYSDMSGNTAKRSYFLGKQEALGMEDSEDSNSSKGGGAKNRAKQNKSGSNQEQRFDNDVKDRISEEVNQMIEVLMTSDEIFDILQKLFNDNFEEIYNSLHEPDEENEFIVLARSSLNTSIKTFKKDTKESVFFYPLKDTLFELSNYLYNTKNEN